MTTQHRAAARPHDAADAPPFDETPTAETAGRAPLSCTRIIDAAVRYVDDNCLDELSMRRLGSELGVEAMSLYRYFPSKAALLEAVVARLLGDLALPDSSSGTDWEDQVGAFAVSFRTITREHPNLMPLLTTMSPEAPVLAGIHERMVDVWRRAGLSEADSQSAQRALQSYLSGSSQWHQESCAGRAAEHDFRYGLDVFLDGVRTRVAEAASA